jgi:hypothetical protein
MAVFRMVPSGGDERYTHDAGRVGKYWSGEATGENGNWNVAGVGVYSVKKAVLSALGSHAFGPGASERAQVYRNSRAIAGGPPATGSTPQNPKKKGFFCSMFVIACYHAAFPDDQLCKKYLPLDAKYTSPMTLDGYLRTRGSPWRLVGTLP